jgi:hypothetical protein
MAAAPASSSRRRLSTLLFSGDADATIGFFKLRPRYLVLNDMMDSLRRLSRVEMEPAAVTAGEFLVSDSQERVAPDRIVNRRRHEQQAGDNAASIEFRVGQYGLERCEDRPLTRFSARAVPVSRTATGERPARRRRP